MNKVMAHLVAGYPSETEAVELMLGMNKLGVYAIEVQIPFSDPIADGTTIMRANDTALESGMTLQKSFDMIALARKKGLKSNVYVMSYLQKLIHDGLRSFCEKAHDIEAKGLIIPDLPFDSEEYPQIKKQADKYDLEIVPVISPSMSKSRLSMILSDKPKLVYLTSMKGITGKNLVVSSQLKDISALVKKISGGSQLAIGFGVKNRSDVEEILKIADISIIGSELIRQINTGGYKQALNLIKKLI